MNTCNSLYFYTMNDIEQVLWVAKVATHCIYGATHYNLIAILSKQHIFNYYATPLQL